MSVQTVKEYLRAWGKENAVMEFDASCATVELAAKTVGVPPSRIAKTLSFKSGGADPAAGKRGCILVVAAGDARIDSRKFKKRFGMKSKMLDADEVVELTGHTVGGVCPFATGNPEAAVYLDVSLRRFDTVFPSCGGSNAVIELSCEELHAIAAAKGWVDVCKDWEGAS